MISITLYKQLWDAVAQAIGANQAILVRTEGEFAQKIKSIDDGVLLLIVVVPSSDTDARNLDNIIENETIIVYVVKKVNHKDQDDADMVADMVQTQNAVTAVKDYLYDHATDCDATFHKILKRIDFNQMRTDPEYNYMGTDGYSVSVPLTTPGFFN